MDRALRSLFVTLFLLGPSFGQICNQQTLPQVIRVGPTWYFKEINQVTSLGLNGITILVDPGPIYQRFTVFSGTVIHSSVANTPFSVQAATGSLPSIDVSGLPAGQPVTITEFNIVGFSGSAEALRVINCASDVVLKNGTVSNFNQVQFPSVGQVALVRDSLPVFIENLNIVPNPGDFGTQANMAGVNALTIDHSMSGGTNDVVTQSFLRGLDNADGTAGHGIATVQTSNVWIERTVATGGDAPFLGIGGDGVNAAGSTVRRCPVPSPWTGGAGAFGGGLPLRILGSTIIDCVAPTVTITAPDAVVVGTSFTMTANWVGPASLPYVLYLGYNPSNSGALNGDALNAGMPAIADGVVGLAPTVYASGTLNPGATTWTIPVPPDFTLCGGTAYWQILHASPGPGVFTWSEPAIIALL